MTKTTENIQKERIDDLEDQRFNLLCIQVGDLHKILIGNGKEGLIQNVAKNTARIRILMWVCAVIFSCLVGSMFGTKIEIPKIDELMNVVVSGKI